MKILKILSVLLVCLLLCACGEQDPADPAGTSGPEQNLPETMDYQVTVADAKGNPYSAGVIVRILKDGEQITMQVVDEAGSVVKNLDTGDYTVELMFTDTNAIYVYDQTNLTLTPEKPNLEISLAYGLGEQTVELFHNGAIQAHDVDVCCTYVTLTAGQRNYFLFSPKQAGTYEVSVIGDVESLGWYGTPHYMSDTTMTPVENNSFSMSIRADMIGSGEGGTTTLVIGIDPGTAADCILSIQRTGDPAWSPEDVPYEIYEARSQLIPYTLPEGATLLDFDLTAPTENYKLVQDDNGFYHLNDASGPLVLVKLGVDNKYTSSFKTMMENTGIRAYFYDENGEFLRREDYYECLVKYAGRGKSRTNPEPIPGVMDETAGVYPLTDDLVYIIQNHGRHTGWFDFESERCIFRDNSGNIRTDINPELAWLFMCVYIAQ